jgi:hypothetical protein
MRKFRFSIGGLMAVVLVLAIGFAALRNASQTWAGLMFLLTCGVLGLAVVGAVCRREAERAWWLGFAVFGWGYMILAFWPSESLPELPTQALLDVLRSIFLATPQGQGFVPAMAGAFGGGGGFGAGPMLSSSQIGHCLWALLFALLGGTLARVLYGAPADRTESPDPHAQPRAQSPSNGWLRLTGVVLVAAIVVVSIAAIESRSAADVWAGAAFLLTCGLLGLAILGALFGAGRSREVCMGAALFGIGYLLLAFGRSSAGTEPFLNAIRPWFPVVPTSIAVSNARILNTLDQPISMSFANETPLDDVLKYIQQATSSPGYSGIPIYVDPLGLQEAERSLNSTIQIDLEGVPLKATLRLCLKQLGLEYRVQDGYLWITSEDAVSSNSNPEDPFLIAGHCLLTLLATGLGGVLAPLASAARREQPGRRGIAAASAPVSSP